MMDDKPTSGEVFREAIGNAGLGAMEIMDDTLADMILTFGQVVETMMNELRQRGYSNGLAAHTVISFTSGVACETLAHEN